MICKHCEVEIWSECYTPEIGEYDHPGYCCDCFDLSWFHDAPGCLDQLNQERAAKGVPPITKPWPAGGYPG